MTAADSLANSFRSAAREQRDRLAGNAASGNAASFVFGCGDAPIAEMIDDVARMDFLEQLNVWHIAELCWYALDQHDGSLRRAIDATIVSIREVEFC